MAAVDQFLQEAGRRFGDFVFHNASFKSLEQARAFVSGLPFTSGTGNSIKFAPHTFGCVLSQPDGTAMVLLAGRFTLDENYAIRKSGKASATQTDCGALCKSQDDPAVRNLMAASERLSNEERACSAPNEGKPKKPWWRLW